MKHNILHLFKSIKIRPVTPSNLPEVIRTFQGNRFENLDDCELLLPPSFNLIKEDNKIVIRRELQFQDFK